MAVAAGEPTPMESFQRSPKAPPSASSPDRSSVHCCERISPVKNRMPEIGASGTVRGEGGNILTYSAFELSQGGNVGFEACRRGHAGLIGKELQSPSPVRGREPFQEQTAEQT